MKEIHTNEVFRDTSWFMFLSCSSDVIHYGSCVPLQGRLFCGMVKFTLRADHGYGNRTRVFSGKMTSGICFVEKAL